MEMWFRDNGKFDPTLGKYTINEGVKGIKDFMNFEYDSYKKENIKILDLSNFAGDVLPAQCFNKCEFLKSVILSEGLKGIGMMCFSGCISLENVTGGGNLEKIYAEAFKNCTKLKKVSFGSTLNFVSSSAFLGCETLSGDFVFNGPVTIGDSAFRRCIKLKNIHFKNSVIFKGKNNFKGCKNLPYDILSNKPDENNLDETVSAFIGSNYKRALKWVVPKTIDEEKFDEDWRPVTLPLFPGEGNLPRPSDIVQGSIGDCWLLSILSSLASTEPKTIRKCMEDDIKNKCVFVTLYEFKLVKRDILKNSKCSYIVEPAGKVKIKVNRTVAVKEDNGELHFKYGRTALWVMIMEKAMATYMKKYLGSEYNLNDMAKILYQGNYYFYNLEEKNPNLKNINAAVAMTAITGKTTKVSFAISDDELEIVNKNDNIAEEILADKAFSKIKKGIDKGHTITCGMVRNMGISGLFDHHEYSVIGTLRATKNDITDMKLLPNEDLQDIFYSNIMPLFESAKPFLRDKEDSFFILRNPHGDGGVMTISSDEQRKFTEREDNNGVCIIDAKCFVRCFDNKFLRALTNEEANKGIKNRELQELSKGEKAMRAFEKIRKKIAKGKPISCSMVKGVPSIKFLFSGEAYAIVGTLSCIEGSIRYKLQENQVFEKNIKPILKRLSEQLRTGEYRFFVVCNYARPEGGIIIKLEDGKYKKLMKSNNDGICIIDVEWFIRHFYDPLA